MTQSRTRPRQAIVLRRYEDLTRFVRAFADGHLNLLILIGGPGLAKSQTVRASVGRRACWIEGNATAFGMYDKLYQHRDQLVVIDDVDCLYSDRAAVRLLKCLCQTDPVKRLGWHSAAATTLRSELPREFETQSRVIIIANSWKTLDQNVAAVQDRGHLVFFEPTPEEVHREVGSWFWDQEVYDWFAAHLHLVPALSMRHYVRAAELKAAGINWLQVLLSDAVSEKTLLVARLRADVSYASEKERIEAFVAGGAGCRATYFNHAKKLRSKRRQAPLPRIVLRHITPGQNSPALRQHVG